MHNLPAASFADIAVALFEETRHYADSNERLEVLTERLAITGLSEATRERILGDAIRHAELMAAAHKIFRAMCDHEEAIRVLIEGEHEPLRRVG